MSDTDAGERVAIAAIREEVRGKPILDLGVGTGRTIPLFAPLTHDYRGIDYLQAMVDECRARYPAARVDLGDARDLCGQRQLRRIGEVERQMVGSVVAHA